VTEAFLLALRPRMWLAIYPFMFRGDGARCRTIADEMLELSRRHALKQILAVAQICSGWARVDIGETGSGLKLLEQGLEDYRSLGQRGWLPHLLCVCADARIHAGDHARALEPLGEALEISEQTKRSTSSLNRETRGIISQPYPALDAIGCSNMKGRS
jgi:hypothetical protein